jgi:acyl-coenzyme A synthetase/AMP-(fatty) acid ligase
VACARRCGVTTRDFRLRERFNAAAFFVDHHVAEGRGERTAFRYAGRAITYGDVTDRLARAAGALAGLGVEIGNRVLLALHDQPAFVAAFWGAVKLGAVAVPVNTLMSPDGCAPTSAHAGLH